jgi:hypothetical protein
MSQEKSNPPISREDGLRAKLDMRRPAVAFYAQKFSRILVLPQEGTGRTPIVFLRIRSAVKVWDLDEPASILSECRLCSSL